MSCPEIDMTLCAINIAHNIDAAHSICRVRRKQIVLGGQDT
jgi:hypothetical protein